MTLLSTIWMLCATLDSRDYHTRDAATKTLSVLVSWSPVSLFPVMRGAGAEGRQRIASLFAQYRSLEELPGLYSLNLDEPTYWRLYTRVTGIPRHHATVWDMPSYDESQHMVRLYADELFYRGYPRWYIRLKFHEKQ